MKKTFAFLLAVFILTGMIMGCSSGSKPKDSATPEPTEQVTAAGNNSDNDPDVAVVPSNNYEAYIEAKGEAVERVSDKMDEDPSLAMTAAPMLFLIAGADMFFVPIYFVGLDAEAYAALEMVYGLNGVDIQSNGQVYTITFTDEEGATMVMTCEYDLASDSMHCTMDDGAGANLIFEYVKTNDGYASQYYIYENGGHTLIKTYFNETDVVACGFMETDEAPTSIFKNGNLNKDFVINDEMYVMLIGDELTIFDDGELNTY